MDHIDRNVKDGPQETTLEICLLDDSCALLLVDNLQQLRHIQVDTIHFLTMPYRQHTHTYTHIHTTGHTVTHTHTHTTQRNTTHTQSNTHTERERDVRTHTHTHRYTRTHTQPLVQLPCQRLLHPFLGYKSYLCAPEFQFLMSWAGFQRRQMKHTFPSMSESTYLRPFSVYGAAEQTQLWEISETGK